jgi:hypothetical protein
MFEFTGRPLRMLACLEAYLADAYWCHASDLLEMVVRTPEESWPLWTEEQLRDDAVRRMLVRVLGRWGGFRNGLGGQQAALRRELASFIADMQALPGSRLYLVDVPEAEIEDVVAAAADRLVRFALDVKGTDSPVLASKTAHLLLIPLMPAYDNLMIRSNVLPRLTRYGRDMQSYLRMCWWVLRQFRAEGTLEQARARVGAYLVDRCRGRGRALLDAARDHWLLQALDTVIAEYSLIGMADSGGDDYPLRWAV